MLMKRLLSTVVFMLGMVLPLFAQGSMAGSGTQSDPYKIYYPDQLNQLRNYLGQSGVVFKLMNDIDLTTWIEGNNPGQGWEPVGTSSAPFQGVFDGNNKKITGFSITRSSTSYVGFFGYLSGATVKNLTINGGEVKGSSYVGAFAGYATGSTLSGLTYEGNVIGSSYTGGIVGKADGTSTTLSTVKITGNVQCSGSYSGGIAGFAYYTITSATVNGNVTGKMYTGGITGYANFKITTATVTGNVTGTQYAGGIAGYSNSSNGTLSTCRSTGDVSGTSYVGGICGYSKASFSACKSIGSVNGTGDYVGGVVGYLKVASSGSIDKCSSFGDITGGAYVGGVAGYCGITLTGGESFTLPSGESFYRVYNQTSYKDYRETLTESSYSYNVSNSYAVGNITSSSSTGKVGGIVGAVESGQESTRTEHVFNLSHYDKSKTYYSNYWFYYGPSYDVNLNLFEHRYNCWDEDERTATYYTYTTTKGEVTVNDCYFNGSIDAKDYTGGVVGYMKGGNLLRNYSNATISGGSKVGGVVGTIEGYVSNTNVIGVAILKSNMSLNNTISGTASIGRIYGTKGSNVTVGSNGNASEDNRALYDTQVILSGVTQEISDNEQNGVNNGAAYFKLKANYVSHGWDFSSDWTNQETETYPYKTRQAAPPKITNSLVSGDTSISGQSVDGGTVFIKIGNGDWQQVSCSGTSWSLTGIPALKSGQIVKLYSKTTSKEESCFTQVKVGFPGSGTENDPWRVYTADDLQGVYKAGYYKQMNDINLTSWINTNSPTAGWVPVGYAGTDPVVYDGDNHKVTGLWINTTEDYTGLFSQFSQGTIRNLTVEVTSKKVKGGNYTGIVIGKIGTGTIENVTATGNVAAGNYVGGVAGYTSGTTLTQLSYTGQLTASGYVGGITSYTKSVNVTDCEAKDIVINASASPYVGGLVAYANSTTVNNCDVSGSITLTGTNSGAKVAGLVAYSTNTPITECFTNVTIRSASPSGSTGGLVGVSNGNIKRCASTGSVSSTGADSYSGGLVGGLGSNYLIENCYSTSTVSGTKWAAGLVAYSYGKVNHCYASGNISGVYIGAGVVGENDGSYATTTNCVALNSKIELSDQSAWGLRVVGNFKNNAPEPDMDNLFAWQGMQVSINGVPKSITDNNLDGTSITTVQTTAQGTYESLGWDFDEVWTMNANGYPELNWLAVAAEPDITIGDLNGDGSVSITDVVLIIDVIAGTITDANQVAAADVNGDGTVSITDCVAAIDLIAAQQHNSPLMAMAPGMMTISDYISGELQDGKLTVELNNENRYTAFQMLVSVPEGMTLVKASMDEVRGAEHQMFVRNIGDGQYLVAGFSLDNEELTGNSGRLLTIETEGQTTGNIVISDVEFATADAKAWHLEGITVSGSTTGIADMNVNSEQTVYDLQGRKLDSQILRSERTQGMKRIVIVNGKKVVTK